MFKKNENGRSMVEMLGVLAIIGVLSVAGIAGYTVAMRKHKANEIAEAISMLAIAARTANGGSGIKTTSEDDYTELLGRPNPSGAGTLKANLTDGDDKVFAGTITFQALNNDSAGEALCNELAHYFGDDSDNPLHIKENNCGSNAELIIETN